MSCPPVSQMDDVEVADFDLHVGAAWSPLHTLHVWGWGQFDFEQPVCPFMWLNAKQTPTGSCFARAALASTGVHSSLVWDVDMHT